MSDKEINIAILQELKRIANSKRRATNYHKRSMHGKDKPGTRTN